MANLNEFIGSIKTQGLMRSNRYAINFSLPRNVQNSGSDLRSILLFCDSVTLPGVTISTTPALTYGEIREMPYEKLFAPVTFTFFMDTAMNVKQVFDNWQAAIVDPVTRQTGYYDDYTTDIEITVFDINDNSRYSVKLYQAYLKDLGQISMDYANKDVMKLPVTMQYKWWESSKSATSLKKYSNGPLGDFFGDSFNIPDGYFSDFTSFQSSFERNIPSVGQLSLPGASIPLI